MSIHWRAIAIGYAVDFLLSVMLGGFFSQDDIAYGTLGSPVAPALLAVSVVVMLASGYAAGRVAQQDGLLHGVLLGAVDVLMNVVLGGLSTRLLVLSVLVGWAAAALGGFLSRFPARAE